MEDRGGLIELLIPYATLEPVRELLLQMFMGEKFGRDSIWEGHLPAELWQTDISIDAVLDQVEMPLGKVLEWIECSELEQSGRASGRERGCQSGAVRVRAVRL